MSEETRAPAAARRLFVALRVEPVLAGELDARVAAALGAQAEAALRRVPPAHLHLTLLFLGQVEAEPAGLLGDALGAHLKGLRRPQLEIGTGGCFGARGGSRGARKSRPRVWYLHLAERAEAAGRLAELRSAVLAAARSAGLGAIADAEAERPFQPHLTVARARDRGPEAGPEARRRFGELAPPGPWTPPEATLLESRPGSGPGRYRTLASFELAP